MATYMMLIFIVIFITSSFSVQASGDEDLYSLVVEHSFDPSGLGVYSRRGMIDVQSLKSNIADYTPEATLSDVEKAKLKELADNDELYRIRVGKWNSDGSSISYVHSCVKACALYESRLSDVLTIHVDQSGGLIAASLSVPVPYCSGVSHHLTSDFNTTVMVQQTVHGPAPDTQVYIQKLEQEKIEKAKGQQADNRSFFAKYWMYLVPLVIFMMFLSNVDPNQAQGGGGGR